MKFAEQLIVIIIFAVVISSAIMGYIGYLSARDALEENIRDNQLELAKEILNKIDRVMYREIREIQVIANSLPIENSLLIGDEESIKAAKNRLNEFKFQTGPWDELEIFSADGINILSSEKQGVDKSIGDYDKEGQKAISEALQGNAYVSDLIMSEETKRPTVIFAAPIRDEKNGNIIVGAVEGKFSWPVIMEILDEVEKPGERQIRLFNKNGMTIGTPTIHRDEILQRDLQHVPIVQKALKGECSSSSSSSRFIYEKDPHQEGDIHYPSEHIPSLNSCALQKGYLGYKGNGWGILIETSQDLILEPVQRLTQIFLLAAIIVSILFVPAALILSRSITKPIIKLKDSARNISRGHMDAKIEIKGSNEIRDLAESFDDMRFSLKSVIEEYERIKGNEELQRNVTDLQKKQADTIKRLRISIAEQKIAQTAEQKALSVYRAAEKKLEFLAKIPETNPHILMNVDKNGKILYSNPAAKKYAKKFKLSTKQLLPKKYIEICKKVSGTNKSTQEKIKIKGREFLFEFVSYKKEKKIFVTAFEFKK